MDPEDYELYFDEGDEFQKTELDYIEREKWDELLALYEREFGNIGAAEKQKANELRTRIEAMRERMYGDVESAEF